MAVKISQLDSYYGEILPNDALFLTSIKTDNDKYESKKMSYQVLSTMVASNTLAYIEKTVPGAKEIAKLQADINQFIEISSELSTSAHKVAISSNYLHIAFSGYPENSKLTSYIADISNKIAISVDNISADVNNFINNDYANTKLSASTAYDKVKDFNTGTIEKINKIEDIIQILMYVSSDIYVDPDESVRQLGERHSILFKIDDLSTSYTDFKENTNTYFNAIKDFIDPEALSKTTLTEQVAYQIENTIMLQDSITNSESVKVGEDIYAVAIYPMAGYMPISIAGVTLSNSSIVCKSVYIKNSTTAVLCINNKTASSVTTDITLNIVYIKI